LIDTICPRCETVLHLDQSTRGKRIRCPKCRRSFEVREIGAAPPTPAPAAPGNVWTGSVGDIVPIPAAESVAEPPAPAGAPPSDPFPQAPPLGPIVPTRPVEPPGPPQPPPSPPARRPGAPRRTPPRGACCAVWG